MKQQLFGPYGSWKASDRGIAHTIGFSLFSESGPILRDEDNSEGCFANTLHLRGSFFFFQIIAEIRSETRGGGGFLLLLASSCCCCFFFFSFPIKQTTIIPPSSFSSSNLSEAPISLCNPSIDRSHLRVKGATGIVAVAAEPAADAAVPEFRPLAARALVNALRGRHQLDDPPVPPRPRPAYPSLEPKIASFTHDDGRIVKLIQADGTVPMPFQGITYNIPVVIWPMESCPGHPPCVYVNPTCDMVIKRPHPHVNPSGLVSVPYLHHWVYPSSNLVDLIRNLSLIFARDPPLYSQRRPIVPTSPSPGRGFGLMPGPGSRNYVLKPAIVPRDYPPSPYGAVPMGGASQRIQTEDSNEAYKRNVVAKIVETVHGDVAALRKAREAEMEGLFGAGGSEAEGGVLSRGVKEMQDKKEALEQ